MIFRPLFVAALLGTSLTALAADSGWYVAADLGRAEAANSGTKMDLGQVYLNYFKQNKHVFGTFSNSLSFNERHASWNLLLGYQFNKNFALEGGYVDLGRHNTTFSILPVNTAVDGGRISAIGIYPISEVFSVNGKIHALYSNINAKIATQSSCTHSDGSGGQGGDIPSCPISWETLSISDSFWSVGYGIGLEYKFAAQLALRGNWDRYPNIGDKNIMGENDIDVLSLGLKYSF